MVWSAIVWLVIVLVFLWALFRIIRGPSRKDNRGPGDDESHGPFRK